MDSCTLCVLQGRIRAEFEKAPRRTPTWNGVPLRMSCWNRAEIQRCTDFLDACIVDLDEVIGRLSRKRDELVLERQAYKNVTSSILQMPAEMHALIFKHCVDDWVQQSSTLPDENPHHWRIPPRHLITQVCWSWRATALSSPELWCDIDIIEYMRSKGDIPLLNDLILSKGLPLQIFYSTRQLGPIKSIESPPYSHIFQLLVQTRSRWVSFTAGHRLNDFYSFMTAPGTIPRFPLLRSLQGYLSPNHELFRRELAVRVNTPSLVDINLGFHWQRSHVEQPRIFPWSNLRRVGFLSGSHLCMASVLTKVSNLTELELGPSHRPWDRPSQPFNKPIVLPFLDTLIIRHGMSGVSPSTPHLELVSVLRLPSLKKLSIIELRDFSPLLQMLEATNHTDSPDNGVQVLELDHLNVGHLDDEVFASFSPLFTHLDKIKVLSVRRTGGNFCDRLLTSLICDPALGNDLFCPSLEQFTIADAHFSAQSLEQFITSRLDWRRNRLSHLIIDNSHLFSTFTLKEDIQELASALWDFIQLPDTRLRFELYFMLRLNGVDTNQRIYYSGRSKRAT